jgi:predicted MFS family arabinose efflux permease
MPFFVWSAALLEGLALTLIQGFLPLYVRRTLGEAHFLTVGLVVAVPAVGTMLASNFWGGLSDVSGRLRPFILIGVLGYAAALAGVPLLQRGPAVLVYVFLASLLYGTLAPSLKTYVTLARPAHREHALAYLLMAQSGGWLIGSAAGGYLYEGEIAPGFRLALFVCAGLLALHAVGAARWLPDLRRPPLAPLAPQGAALEGGATPQGSAASPGARPDSPARRGWLPGLLADLISLYENPRLLRLCAVSLFAVSGNYVAWGFFTVYYTELLHAGMRTVGLALALSAALGIAAYFGVGPLVKRFGGGRCLAAVTTLYLLMYLGIASTRNVLVAGGLYAIPLYGLFIVAANSLAAEYSSEEQRGGGLGVLNGVWALGTLAGPLVGGLLADAHGLRVVPWTAFGFMAPASAIAWIALWRTPQTAPNGRKAG